MNITEAEIQRQFQRIKDMGWLPDFLNAGYNVPVDLLLGIASRETNCHNIIGDGGHGHGIMQIDDRSFPEWCRQGKWKSVAEGVKMGALVFCSKLNTIKNNLPPDKAFPAAVSAYNCGVSRALEGYHMHGNPDAFTTGRDYSRDVLARAASFKKLLP